MNSLDGRSRAHQLESIQMNMSVQWLLVCVCLTVISCGTAYAQERTQQHMVVSAEAEEAEHDQFSEMGEYAQPAWAERSRFSSTTSVYVLSPYEMFAGNIWEADFGRHGKTLHDLTQEIDLGLLHRFEVGFENELGVAGSDAHETSATVEARYAFANWNAIPLNPAISAAYILVSANPSRTLRATKTCADNQTRSQFGFFSGKTLPGILGTDSTLDCNRMSRATLDASSRSASQ
jgi:hypothetical protein